jgi:hypothetical protein
MQGNANRYYLDLSRPRKICHCGSGQYPQTLYDARGIPVGRCCRACEAKLRAKYRPEIFTDSQYECDERIEELD